MIYISRLKWLSLALLLPSIAHAQSGFYAAVQGGFMMGNSKAKTNYNRNIDTNTDNSPLGGRSLLGGIFAGGGGNLGKIYLGLRGGVAWQNVYSSYRQAPALNTDAFYSLKLRDTFDLTGLVGFEPRKDILLYLKVASTWGRWSAFTQNNILAGSPSTSKSTYRPGFGMGLGVEASFCPTTHPRKGQWIWGSEFTYTSYSSFRLATQTNLGGVTTFSPRTGAFTIHIKRTF